MMNTKIVLLVLCVALTVLSGILRGVVDQRWGYSEEMLAAAQRLEDLPAQIGPWKAVYTKPLNEEAAEMLRCAGSVVIQYEDQQTKEVVNMVFLVGPAGPLAIHTPEVCYGANNYTIVQGRRGVSIDQADGKRHRFSVVTFSENDLGNRLQRVYYGWNRTGTWMAPDQPRSAFAGMPMLYKVQVATNALGSGEKTDAAERFLKDCLPIWEDICR